MRQRRALEVRAIQHTRRISQRPLFNPSCSFGLPLLNDTCHIPPLSNGSLDLDAFYDAYYQELLAGAVIARWQKIDLFINLLVALTTSGSTFSGLVWWNTPSGKPIWGILAAIASIAAIFHGVARVGTHLQQQGEARRDFSLLRGNLQYVLHKMTTTGDDAELESKFEGLRSKLVELTA